MNAEQFLKKYVTLTVEQRITFLARLAASITVDARGTYVPGTDGVAEPSRLREFNEFLHRVTFQLTHMLSGTPERYPDAVFAEIVWDFAEAVASRDSLVAAMKSVTTETGRRRSSVA
jgi:hypothetical protein